MTTNQLINIQQQTIGNDTVNAVSARDLYTKLGLNPTQWARWSKKNIEENEFFTENKDWVGFDIVSSGQNSNLRNETKDYMLSLDFAKHLCMQARTKVAHDMRNYFIECEKRALNPQVTIPQTYAAALLEAAKLAEQSEKLQLENKTLEAKIEADKPKVKLGEMMTMVDATILIGDYAIMLQNEHKIKIGQNRLFAWLRENGYLCKEEKFKNRPTQKSMELELFAWTERIITTNHGSEIIQFTPRITGKGQVYFLERILKDFNEKGRKENAAA